jgi:hypothetical protein
VFKPISDRPWWRCIVELAELLRSWWRIDRIRASPQDGRLLRLGPLCILFIRGCAFQVQRRAVVESETGPCVNYDCAGESSAGQLWVTASRNHSAPQVCWVQGGEREDLSPSDVQVFETKTSPLPVGGSRPSRSP